MKWATEMFNLFCVLHTFLFYWVCMFASLWSTIEWNMCSLWVLLQWLVCFLIRWFGLHWISFAQKIMIVCLLNWVHKKREKKMQIQWLNETKVMEKELIWWVALSNRSSPNVGNRTRAFNARACTLECVHIEGGCQFILMVFFSLNKNKFFCICESLFFFYWNSFSFFYIFFSFDFRFSFLFFIFFFLFSFFFK